MVGPVVFKSVPISNATTNWSVYDYGRIDEGFTSGYGDTFEIVADDGDENETQSYNHTPPPADLNNIDQIVWHVRSGTDICCCYGNIYVDGVWQAQKWFIGGNTDHVQTLTGPFTDFSTFQCRFVSGTLGKGDENRIDYSTIILYGYGTTNLQGGNLQGGTLAG